MENAPKISNAHVFEDNKIIVELTGEKVFVVTLPQLLGLGPEMLTFEKEDADRLPQ